MAGISEQAARLVEAEKRQLAATQERRAEIESRRVRNHIHALAPASALRDVYQAKFASAGSARPADIKIAEPATGGSSGQFTSVRITISGQFEPARLPEFLQHIEQAGPGLAVERLKMQRGAASRLTPHVQGVPSTIQVLVEGSILIERHSFRKNP